MLIYLLGTGVAIASYLFWPARTRRATHQEQLLDEILPEFEFSEYHETWIKADPQHVWQALNEVTGAEAPLFGALMKIRMLAVGRLGGDELFSDTPVLTLMKAGGGFRLLDERPGQEMVIGMVGRPWATEVLPLSDAGEFFYFRAPNSVRAAFNFRLEPARGGVRLSTETRVQGTDPAGIRWFTPYWRVVQPGSAMIRRAWLRAISRRALRSGPNAERKEP